MIARLLISPSLRERIKEIEKILLEYNLSVNHPDLLYLSHELKIGIAEARKIKNHFTYKSFTGQIKAAVLEDASQMSLEAQNALLKTLEELPTDGLMILGADSDSKLLPTVLSRCQIINLAGEKYNSYNNYIKDLENLLKVDISKRFDYVEKLKDKEEFFHSLISYFHQKLPADVEFTKKLLQAEQWQKQNVNLRAILEYLMLVMPKLV